MWTNFKYMYEMSINTKKQPFMDDRAKNLKDTTS